MLPPQSPSGWLGSLSGRERTLLGVAALALLLFAAWMLSDGDAQPGVELVASPPGPASTPAPIFAPTPPPVYSPPSPAAPGVATAPALTTAPVMQPAPSAGGLILNGVMGRGAILTMPDGQQRAIALGREFLPGMTLKEVGVGHALIAGPGGEIRLELNRFVTPAAAAAGAVPAAPTR